MSRQKKIPATSKEVDKAFGVVEKGLRMTGRLLSEKEDEIRQSELLTDIESVELPEVLQDPMATLSRGREVLETGFSKINPRSESKTSETHEHLKRAARNRGVISESIQKQMEKDRAAVKAKNNE